MKYVQPYGVTDPDAGYKDRNTPGAEAGSRVPAAAVENPMREIMAVIMAAGIDPYSPDLTQVLQAINALIAAATGGAGDPNYVLMTQARVRLPIFLEVLTSDGLIPIASPSNGTIRVPAGYNFLHRGIFNVTTVLTDLVTTASKTYHLRWNPTDGFALKDINDSGYNPGMLDESNAAFDSKYDDMLVAKAVTNASNAATIILLKNKAALALSEVIAVSNTANANSISTTFDAISSNYNWARTPGDHALHMCKWLSGHEGIQRFNIGPLGTSAADLFTNATVFNVTRYHSAHSILASYAGPQAQMQFSARA